MEAILFLKGPIYEEESILNNWRLFRVIKKNE